MGLLLFTGNLLRGQVENVPVTNQVYEYLDRLGVRGILPLFSSVSIPLTRGEVAALLVEAAKRESLLSKAEMRYLRKFEREFAHEIPAVPDDRYAIFGDSLPTAGFFAASVSQREKYLFAFSDSNASLYAEFIGGLDYRVSSGDSYGDAHATLGTIGGRFRGTALNILGYFLQATNGELWGNRALALSDPELAGNVKFNELGSPYFDFTEAYLQLKLDWFSLEFGRERRLVGTGYSDRLVLSDNAPVFDFLRLGASYRSFRFNFLAGRVVQDSAYATGLAMEAEPGMEKYFALHRFQFSLFSVMNFSAGEMVIYQRFAPEFAYLNPVNFFKSSEHQLGDRDNALLVFDTEIFPLPGYKLYGSWLIDDIDFSKLGTNWWGNEFGWQGGLYAAGFAPVRDLDALVEYTRINPYVYSHRVAGNDYTTNSVSMGHHLQPNSDECLLEFRYRPDERVRLRAGFAYRRHGDNVMQGDSVTRNVGGSVLVGHRDGDSETVKFLDGIREDIRLLRFRVDYEPITNFFLAGRLEYQSRSASGGLAEDVFASVGLRIEY